MSSEEYSNYLLTGHWREVREARLIIDGYQCCECGSAKNLHVHHVSYDNLGNEDIEHDLITLCNRCHDKLHRFEEAAKQYTVITSAFAKSLSRDNQNNATAAFFWYAWPKFTVNGGSVNLLDMSAFSALRKEWCDRVGISESNVQLLKIHDFANKFLNYLIFELSCKGLTTKEITDQLGVSESSVYKRRKELKMKIGNWTTVDAANVGGGDYLEAGGYVMRIVRVVDHPNEEYIDVVVDVAEGEHAGIYAGLPASDDWRHSYRRYYSNKAAAFFKQFLEALEISNRGRFSIEDWQQRCNEQEFVGLTLGVILQKQLFTKKRGNNAGKDGWRLQWFASVPAQDIRNGEFTVPADDDQRERGASASTGMGDVYGDIDL